MPDTLLFVSNSAHAATLQEQLAPYFSILQAPDIHSAERLLSQTPEITAITAPQTTRPASIAAARAM